MTIIQKLTQLICIVIQVGITHYLYKGGAPTLVLVACALSILSASSTLFVQTPDKDDV